jgi:uncharacterized protein YndB with AHSA1/START domain
MTIIGAAFALVVAAAAAEPVTSKIAIESERTRATVHEVVVPAAPEQVWQAISTPEGWRSWAAPVTWTDPRDPTILESSYDPSATPGSGRTITQRVILSVPQRIYAFRTIKAPDDFRDFDALSQVSWVFELIPEGPARTRVRLTGSGYPRTPGGDHVLRFFDRGNVVSLEFLRQRFEQGPIDWTVQGKRAAAVK